MRLSDVIRKSTKLLEELEKIPSGTNVWTPPRKKEKEKEAPKIKFDITKPVEFPAGKSDKPMIKEDGGIQMPSSAPSFSSPKGQDVAPKFKDKEEPKKVHDPAVLKVGPLQEERVYNVHCPKCGNNKATMERPDPFQGRKPQNKNTPVLPVVYKCKNCGYKWDTFDLAQNTKGTHSVSMPSLDPKTKEWVVKWMVDGNWQPNKSYVTKDKMDAINTYAVMAHKAKELNSKSGA
jgi:DNA-directed RNA polymerase subunit M/transcription elongation factor TFIIS